jgi:alpha-N-arabinofuranosidase
VAFREFSYAATTAPATPPAGEFRNPILTGFFPDPSICQVGSDYYLINSTFAYFPGIPMLHSRDLVNWRQIGNVIHRPDQLAYAGLGVSRGIFAPAITHHNGTFYVVCTMIDAGGNFVVTAKDPAGPWSNPAWLHFEGIDPSLFFDDDGRAWVVNNGAPNEKPRYDGHRAIWIQEYDPVAQKMKGSRTKLVNGGVDIATKPIWIEGPHLYKRNGWYYLSCAEGGTSTQHSQVVFRSRQVEGPYVPWSGNPILTQRDLPANVADAVTSTGHADLVQAPDQSWWAIFLGVRPYQSRYSPMGRETFLLPVQWTDDGWPTILPTGQRVPLVAPSPARAVDEPDAGAVARWTEEFRQPLDLSWLMLRSPQTRWWQVDAAASRLLLNPRIESLASRDNPSFLARRVQHAAFTTTVRVDMPAVAGVSAGLALFQNETHHYFAAVRRTATGAEVVLEQAKGGAPAVIGRAAFPALAAVELRAVVDHEKCTFEYATEPGHWQTLRADTDATLLTSEVAGGFVGATVGLHARLDP